MKLFESRHAARAQWLQRRTFLKAIALGISVPLALKMSKLAVAAPTGKPTRLFTMFLPHGAPNEHYEPVESGGDIQLDATGVGILGALQPYKDYVTVLRGVKNYVLNNHAAIQTVLTGSKDKADDSIDYVIANQLGATAHVLGVQSWRQGSDGPDDDCKVYYQGNWVTPILNPYDAIEDLFPGLAIDSTSAAPAPTASSMSADADFRNEALDLSIQDIEAMQKAVKGLTKEETKLKVHLDSLMALKGTSGGGGLGVVSCKGRPALLADNLNLDKAGCFDPANFNAILDAHLEAAAHAMICGSARVISLQNMYANAQIAMDFPGGPGLTQKNHHDPLSHSFDLAGRTEFATAQKWFYTKLAEKFVKLLAETDDPADPGSKVLDNTTILTCSEISDGANHNSDDTPVWIDGKAQPSYLPWVLIGKGGGLFKGNKIANFTSLDHRNILCAVAESMGVSLPTIGGENVSTPAEVKA